MQISSIQNGQTNALYGVRPSDSKSGDIKEPAPKVQDRDRYIPSEKDESIGLYRPAQDEDGNPKIDRDSPERSESCTANTDKVDHEIEGLKKKAEQLQQRLRSAEGKERERLARQLENLQRELAQKDNDTYRRQHTIFS